MHQFSNIPNELKEFKQWVLWKYTDVGATKPTKVPHTTSGNKASVTNPNDWDTYDNVIWYYNLGGYSGIGFVFTDNDPFAFIDLDPTTDKENSERQIKIFNEFNSYSEKSPSGKGLHIIVRGSIPQGRRLADIEIYSSQRYATMTGNIFKNAPIEERHDLLNQLFTQMGKAPVIYSNSYLDKPEILTDEEILKQASNAINGQKFSDLYKGDWQNYYPKQAAAGQGSSEADFALIDIIAFYTQNRNQIQRIFFSSTLGKKDKYSTRSELVAKMIERSFDKMLPNVDFDGYRIQLEQQLALPLGVSVNGKPAPFEGFNVDLNPTAPTNNGSVAQRLVPVAHNGSDAGSNPATSTISIPPGLLGEIAQFIYEAAPRQVEEVAIAGAIGLMSGICGRSYNVSGTGLNQYLLLLAKTGRGKDAITSGIDKIMTEVKKNVPVANEYIGPELINSGQALIRYISTQSNCFVSVLGEFGFTIERISDPYANSADKMLYANLLSLYSRSGFGQVFKSSIYSKKEDNVAPTESPSVTILGESNPTTFYEAINETMVLAGLLPRFLMIEYDGSRRYFNENSINVKPPEQLINRLSQLTSYCKEIAHRKSVMNVELDSEAKIKMKQYDIETTNIINTISHPAIDELWNRAHLKVLKLAAVVAIGINPYNPTITINEINWAIPIVERDIKSLAHKFDVGAVGKNIDELRQYEDAVRIIKEYITKDFEYASKYRAKYELHKNKVICHTYFSDRLKKLSSFKNDRKSGPTNALKKILQSLIDDGVIVEVTYAEKIKKKYTYLGKSYAVINIE